MSKLEKEMENWRQAELRHASVFGKAALRTKGYQKIRLAEMQRIYRSHRGTKLSLDDRVRLRLLRSGNRHQEKQLYPNRLVRYGRRFLRFTGRAIQNGFRQIRIIAENRRYAPKETVIPEKQVGMTQPTKNKIPVTKVVRLPRRVHKPVEGLEHKRGRSL